MKKIIRYTLMSVIAIIVLAIGYAWWNFAPIMSGMAAKTMCSCVYVMGRTPESVVEKELAVFPGLSRAKIEFRDSTAVTASLFGSTRTAIHRKGLGCTLVAERKEKEIFAQPISAIAAPMLDTLPWPTGNRLSPVPLEGVDYAKIKAALEDAFAESDADRPKNTLAVVVIYQGQIVGEQYAPGIGVHSRLMGWSMTKSLTNAMVGLLVKDGKLRVEDPAPVHEWAADERNRITINDLMHASSGLEWNESYFLPGDFHNMFMFSDDKGGYAASKSLEYPVGSHFEYSSGTTNLLSKIVRQTLGDTAYYSFPYQRLFHKIGMTDALIELDASGTFVGSSYGYASARDWARFGLLFLQDGVWNGERILPEGWSAYSSTPAPSAPLGEYGAQWWLNAGSEENPEKCYHPGLPHDEYGAEGFEEQLVWIFPSKKAIIVRLGVSHHGFDDVGLANKVLAALP